MTIFWGCKLRYYEWAFYPAALGCAIAPVRTLQDAHQARCIREPLNSGTRGNSSSPFCVVAASSTSADGLPDAAK